MGVLDHDHGLWRIMIQFGTMVRSESWSMVLIKPISRIMIMDHMSSRGSDHAHGSWSYGPYHPKFLACGWLTVEYDTMTTFFGMRQRQIKNDFSLLLSVLFKYSSSPNTWTLFFIYKGKLKLRDRFKIPQKENRYQKRQQLENINQFTVYQRDPWPLLYNKWEFRS